MAEQGAHLARREVEDLIVILVVQFGANSSADDDWGVWNAGIHHVLVGSVPELGTLRLCHREEVEVVYQTCVSRLKQDDWRAYREFTLQRNKEEAVSKYMVQPYHLI